MKLDRQKAGTRHRLLTLHCRHPRRRRDRQQRVGQRQQGERSHRRKADPQVERPESRRPRLAVTDPNLPAGLLQSGPTASHDFSCFASTKRPFVISHTRASADVYGDRVGDGTPAAFLPATRLRRTTASDWSAALRISRLLPLNVELTGRRRQDERRVRRHCVSAISPRRLS